MLLRRLWICGFVDLWICGFVDLWICGFVDLGIWGFGDLGIWGFGDLGIWGFGDLGIWGFGDLGIWGFGDLGIWGFGDLGIWGFVDLWICGFVDLWICGFVDAKFHSLSVLVNCDWLFVPLGTEMSPKTGAQYSYLEVFICLLRSPARSTNVNIYLQCARPQRGYYKLTFYNCNNMYSTTTKCLCDLQFVEVCLCLQLVHRKYRVSQGKVESDAERRPTVKARTSAHKISKG